ncbi:hypothetical protein EYF70_01960 [Pseudoduganella albidiflava]|uniref:Uncharacterized protein n=1 Tax=Pseudoduganella albidiflava TaxID=321983 RepID=A0ABX5RN93_9BURK|nr:hypothetical protein EYF70_01960 [Pseudoduganella albidiflava]
MHIAGCSPCGFHHDGFHHRGFHHGGFHHRGFHHRRFHHGGFHHDGASGFGHRLRLRGMPTRQGQRVLVGFAQPLVGFRIVFRPRLLQQRRIGALDTALVRAGTQAQQFPRTGIHR